MKRVECGPSAVGSNGAISDRSAAVARAVVQFLEGLRVNGGDAVGWRVAPPRLLRLVGLITIVCLVACCGRAQAGPFSIGYEENIFSFGLALVHPAPVVPADVHSIVVADTDFWGPSGVVSHSAASSAVDVLVNHLIAPHGELANLFPLEFPLAVTGLLPPGDYVSNETDVVLHGGHFDAGVGSIRVTIGLDGHKKFYALVSGFHTDGDPISPPPPWDPVGGRLDPIRIVRPEDRERNGLVHIVIAQDASSRRGFVHAVVT